MQQRIVRVTILYSWKPGTFVPAEPKTFTDCAELYSAHYGLWATDSPTNPGQRVRLSAKRIRSWLESPDSRISFAHCDGFLVGYAIAVRCHIPRYGNITWVTQLVVHEKYRQQGVAKSLLFSLWTYSDDFAWGLVSANPFAVRALEKATRRRCDPVSIKKHHELLLSFAESRVPYVSKNTEVIVERDKSRINTGFFVDQTKVPQMITDAKKSGAPWLLGPLESGWEWLAFTFESQSQMNLTAEEIESMIETSDQVVRQAYGRMTLDKSHRWTKHTKPECDFIATHCKLKSGDTVLDFGCGVGRHVLQLSAMGFNVTGVDYMPELIKRAQSSATQNQREGISFHEGDCRTIELHQRFAAVTCLYDVIGSFADQASNFKIIRNIAAHLLPGGRALISVMNRTLTERNAKYRFSFSADPNALLTIKPSRTMETTGDIFDPEHYLLDTEKGIVYRKERFEHGASLPTELIVRDRRFFPKEIENLFVAVGLKVEWVRCVRAGDWATELDPSHEKAKEILLLCQKPE